MACEFQDHVRCTSCEEESLAPQGTNLCPCCGAIGNLAWVDEEDTSGTLLPEDKVMELTIKDYPFYEQSKDNADDGEDEEDE